MTVRYWACPQWMTGLPTRSWNSLKKRNILGASKLKQICKTISLFWLFRCRPHLSAGAWMARVPDAKEFLRELENDWKSRGSRIEDRKGRGSEKGWDDQMAFRRLHKRFYPKYWNISQSYLIILQFVCSYKVDTLAKVWTRCDSGYDCL